MGHRDTSASCHKATSDFACSITSALARSEGETVTLFQKRVSFNFPATGGGYQAFEVRLTVASHRVYGWCRLAFPGLKRRL